MKRDHIIDDRQLNFGDLLDRTPAPYVAGSETSREAARRAEGGAGLVRLMIAELIRDRGGLTCDEIEEITGLPHQTASARVSELRSKFGVIECSGLKRPTRRGRAATVWKIRETEGAGA